MAEDIWPEKPQPMLHGVDLETYDAEELNAWLDRLKSSFDESIADCHHSLELVAKKLGEYREKAEKLEAVETFRKHLIEKYGEASNQLIRVHWVVSELEKILEAETK